MKRKAALMLSLVLILFCFAGCMQAEENFEVQPGGSGTVSAVIRFEKNVVDQFAASLGTTVENVLGVEETETVTVEDVEYYLLEEEKEFGGYDELKLLLEGEGYEDVYASEKGVRYLFSSGVTEADVKELEEAGLDIKDSMSFYLQFAMPEEIQMTTGTLSEDGMLAEFLFEGDNFFETHDIVVSMEKESEKPSVSGATSKKTYNSARTITASDISGIEKLQYKYKKPDSSKYGKYYKINDSKTFTKDGTYYIRAYDFYGNKAVKTFTIKDKKKPSITLDGKMNKKKTYYKESCHVTIADNCAVKSVKYYIDGKKVKTTLSKVLDSGIMTEKAGTHKVIAEDVNGNKRTVTFEVK